MSLEKEYQEISKLKQEINHRLAVGTAYPNIRALSRFLDQDKRYQELYTMDNQLIRLQHFLTVWEAEKQELPALGIFEDIFYQIRDLDELEQKYYKIEFYGLRIENHVPERYCQELMDQLMEQKVSGIAFGIIIRNRTENGQQNLLSIARELIQRMDLPNAILLLQYARAKYPGTEELLLTEARCWMQGKQPQRAYELLQGMEDPSSESLKLLEELQQVTGCGKA
ncbi:MAG: hypothetical protein NC331_09820 [Lachnospiraceae bacterium]|nr:hypothetical protein [Lachnospiraceae bacterium]MCM1239669.1 hypothetical protein [Lachnospiraceae bacterium]